LLDNKLAWLHIMLLALKCLSACGVYSSNGRDVVKSVQKSHHLSSAHLLNLTLPCSASVFFLGVINTLDMVQHHTKKDLTGV